MKSLFQKYAVTLILSALLGAYIVFAGVNRTCGACTMITDFVGLSSPPSFGGEATTEGTMAPEWTAFSLEGEAVSSSSLQGQVSLVGFWATWCPPCRREIPGFIELQETYADQGFSVVGLSVDRKPVNEVMAFVEENGINYPVLMANAEIAAAFGGVEAIPTTFLIDREGRIVASKQGYWSRAAIESELKKLL